MRERAPVEHCELCSALLSANHQHLIEPISRKLLCACDACAILFDGHDSKYRRVPQRARFLPDFRLTDTQWESLMIPISMAFFFHSTPVGRVIALYPSPAGPTESLLTFESWDEIVRENPILNEIEPDVEALLVNRVGSTQGYSNAEYFLAPIDECYKLTGLIRAHWHGLSGGSQVWKEIGLFFADLKARSTAERDSACA
jgi:hypothetical protein